MNLLRGVADVEHQMQPAEGRDQRARPGCLRCSPWSVTAARATAEWTRPSLSPAQRRRAPLEEIAAPLHRSPHGEQMCTPLENPTGTLAPTQSGKSRRDLVHKVLAAPGALLCSTTKPDLLEFSALARTRRCDAGPVLVYDATGTVSWPATLRWSPIAGCKDPDVARRRAHTLVEAASVELAGVGGNDKVFRDRAKTVLQAYLLAAAIHGHDVDALVRWAVSKPPDQEPVKLLQEGGHPELARNLRAEIGMVAETSDAVWMSVRRVHPRRATLRTLTNPRTRPKHPSSQQSQLPPRGATPLGLLAHGAEAMFSEWLAVSSAVALRRGVIVAYIFISYATPDRAIAEEVASWLRAVGHEPFLDHDLRDGISVGEDWEQRLYRELRRVDAVIGVVTSSFVASNWCSAEVGIAGALGCRLMPLRAEAGVVHPLMPRLQYADYQADPQQSRDQLLQAVRLLEDGGGTWREGDNPFPGLEPFTAALSRVFSVARQRLVRWATSCARWAVPAGCWSSSGHLAVGSRRCSTQRWCRCLTATRHG